jgi:hypothetical protein
MPAVDENFRALKCIIWQMKRETFYWQLWDVYRAYLLSFYYGVDPCDVD